jgi:U3 small nucleolar ribonucleoprotein protein LCP5
MAVDNSLESLLATLVSSIQSATEALPTEDILPPKDGISLLDAKNELLLSYLQNLVFLILLKIRARSGKSGSLEDRALHPQDEVVQKLIELRVYLEKGVRPLENRLKYNIDKIIRTADDAARRTSQPNAKAKSSSKKSKNNTGSDSNASDAGSDSAQSDDDEDEMAYGPRGAAMARTKADPKEERTKESAKDGIYRPPRITPMAMPIPESREERRERRPGKSATLDEFIATELSSAPIAEPSIGSTIVNGGRHTKSEKERREENERRDYEEANFTRLAPISKKEQAKKGRGQGGGFGGEEWRGLASGIDRIERLTQKKGGKLGSLEASRKRPTSDGPRGSGSAAGDAFEKRRKVVSRYK